jgi:hypothetical protein
MHMMERRFESRFLCADLVRVDWQVVGISDAGLFRTVEAVLEDICALGACVQVEERIPAGAAISIATPSARFSGMVTYCVYRDYGYFVGIRFLGETRWSTGAFEPQHLTNLEALGLAEKTAMN